MNLLRILAVAALSASLIGCSSNETQSPARAQKRARVSQLYAGMPQSQVSRLFGQPDKVDHDDGGYRGGYIPYYGWRGGYSGEQELTWEYKNLDLEVKFRRGRSGWVVKEWDLG